MERIVPAARKALLLVHGPFEFGGDERHVGDSADGERAALAVCGRVKADEFCGVARVKLDEARERDGFVILIDY